MANHLLDDSQFNHLHPPHPYPPDVLLSVQMDDEFRAIGADPLGEFSLHDYKPVPQYGYGDSSPTLAPNDYGSCPGQYPGQYAGEFSGPCEEHYQRNYTAQQGAFPPSGRAESLSVPSLGSWSTESSEASGAQNESVAPDYQGQQFHASGVGFSVEGPSSHFHHLPSVLDATECAMAPAKIGVPAIGPEIYPADWEDRKLKEKGKEDLREKQAEKSEEKAGGKSPALKNSHEPDSKKTEEADSAGEEKFWGWLFSPLPQYSERNEAANLTHKYEGARATEKIGKKGVAGPMTPVSPKKAPKKSVKFRDTGNLGGIGRVSERLRDTGRPNFRADRPVYRTDRPIYRAEGSDERGAGSSRRAGGKPLHSRFVASGPVLVLPSSVQCLGVILDYHGATGDIYRTVINENITNVASAPHLVAQQMQMLSQLLCDFSQPLAGEVLEGVRAKATQADASEEGGKKGSKDVNKEKGKSNLFGSSIHGHSGNSQRSCSGSSCESESVSGSASGSASLSRASLSLHIHGALPECASGACCTIPTISGALQRKVYCRDISSVANAVSHILYVELPNFNTNNPYEPQWYRYELDNDSHIIPESKCGLCPFCREIKFKPFKNSSYLSHLTLEHGVFANSYVIPEGLYYGTYRMARNCDLHKTRLVKGVQCPVCFEVVEVACWKNKSNPLLSFFRHFKKMHLNLTKTFICSTVDPTEVRSKAQE